MPFNYWASQTKTRNNLLSNFHMHCDFRYILKRTSNELLLPIVALDQLLAVFSVGFMLQKSSLL